MKDTLRPSALKSVALALLFASLSARAVTSPAPTGGWVGTWATAPFDGDPWHTVPTLVDSTIRQVVHTTIAGERLRVKFSNESGTEPLRIGAATIALSTGGSGIQAASAHPLTFGGSSSFVVPAGAFAISDPVDLATPAFSDLAISLYLPLQQISHVTVHSSANQDNFIQQGNEVTATSLNASTMTPSWFFVKGVEVAPVARNAASVVAFGDSITDGALAAQNKNERWPDVLATRLNHNSTTAGLSVLNEGIGGNCVLIHCVGQNALARFDRDVLAQPAVRYVVVLESINDIGGLHNPNQPDYKLTADDLEQGFAQLVARAHEHGIKVFGATITPYQGAGYYTEQGEKIREAVNAWIRTSGAFDGVIDFDRVTRDPAEPLRFLPEYDSGDHLHPKGTGYAAMANAIDLSLFQ